MGNNSSKGKLMRENRQKYMHDVQDPVEMPRKCATLPRKFRFSFRSKKSKNLDKQLPPATLITSDSVYNNSSSNGIYTKHLDVKEWLNSIGLQQYWPCLQHFTGVEQMLHLSEGNFREFGVLHPSDCGRMLDSMKTLHDRYCVVNCKFVQKKPTTTELLDPGGDQGDHSLVVSLLDADDDDANCTKAVANISSSKNYDYVDKRRSRASTGSLQWNSSVVSHHHHHRPDAAEDVCRQRQYQPLMIRNAINELAVVEFERPKLAPKKNNSMSTVTDNERKMQPNNDALNRSSDQRRSLEWELSLDSRDLRSHAWYHGAISRQHAEQVVREEGDFLVRDCTSQPGNYVLTCRTKHQALHFVVHKLVLQPDTVYERVQYQFEEDAFDTVPDLITYYVGSGRAITTQSAARIQHPRNRQCPLSHYAAQAPLPSAISRKHGVQRDDYQCNSADGVITADERTHRFNTHSLPRTTTANLRMAAYRGATTPVVQQHYIDATPPKPTRKSPKETITTYRTSGGSDSGNGSADSAIELEQQQSGALLRNTSTGVIIKNPRNCCAPLLKKAPIDYVEIEEKLNNSSGDEFAMPNRSQRSVFDVDTFSTVLLPVGDCKPLDAQALRTIKTFVAETGSRILANHLTRIDLDLVFFVDGFSNSSGDDEHRANACKTTIQCGDGIDLVALPDGHQYRLDLIERTGCLRLMVAATILTCTDETERTEILSKWIEVAIDTKTALGNLFGFTGIMLGLCSPQIERLSNTWHSLRQNYTDAAFNFEAKLRPTFKSMNQCTNPQAPNTTLPHLLPLALLFEHEFDTDYYIDNNTRGMYPLFNACLTWWEGGVGQPTSGQDQGVITLLAHLEAYRTYTAAAATYRRNAEIVLADARLDELILDTFRTEFQMRFLWGSKGTLAPPHERHRKFEQILTVLADNYCNNYSQ